MKKQFSVKKGRLLLPTLMILCCLLSVTYLCSCKANASIVLKEHEISINLLDEAIIEADVKNSKENIIWTTDAPEIATVIDGKITTVSMGTANITATIGNKSDVCLVTVTKPKDKIQIEVNDVSLTLYVGETHNFSISVVSGDKNLDGATIEYVSNNPNMATVDSNGKVTAISKGETTISISGSFAKISLDAVQIPITINEDMKINSNIENNLINLFVSKGRDEQNPFATCFIFNPTVMLNGVVSNNSVITLTSSATEIVSVNDKQINAHKKGSAKITVKAVSPLGTECNVDINVIVEKPLSEITTSKKAIVDKSKSNDWNMFEISDNVLGLTSDGVPVAYELKEDKTFTISEELDSGIDKYIVFETEQEYLKLKIDIVDLKIGSVEDLDSFADKYQSWSEEKYKAYVVLSNNIDYKGSTHYFDTVPYYIGNDAYKFYGVLDGNGYTINNIKLKYGFIPLLAEGAIVKNIAVINIDKSSNGTGMVAGTIDGTMENCYFEGSMPLESTNKDYTAFASVAGKTAVIRNIIVNCLDKNSKTQNNGLKEVKENALIENLYVIGNGNGYLFGNVSDGVYSTIKDFNKCSDSIFSKFTDNNWSSESGTLIFKTSEQFLPKKQTTINFISLPDELLVGGEGTFKVNYNTNIIWELTEAVQGTSIKQNGIVSIDEEVKEGTKIKIKATYYGPIYGEKLEIESKEYSLLKSESVNINENPFVVAKNRNEKCTYDTSSLGQLQILNVSSGVNKDNITSYSYENNIFSVDAIDLISGENSNLVITAKSLEKYYIITYKLNVVDFAIGKKEELDAFATTMNEKKGNYYGYVVLTNNFTYDSKCLSVDKAKLTGAGGGTDYWGLDKTFLLLMKPDSIYFSGIFDGQGYCINGICLKYGFIPRVKGTVKNIALTNVIRDADGSGGFIRFTHKNSLVENCFIQMTDSEQRCGDTNGAGIVAGCNGGTVKNIIAFYEQSHITSLGYAGAFGNLTNEYGKEDGFNYSSIYVISSTSKIFSNTEPENNDNLYKDVASFKNVVSDISKFFNDYWEINDGLLIFKSAVNNFNI